MLRNVIISMHKLILGLASGDAFQKNLTFASVCDNHCMLNLYARNLRK